ncbi:hypothetical protein GH741_21170 [Aquibacillus halophilus]|uniref:Uncharacterized protein n=1 Tax=Aquibacillus halophilus TaxID=930132 RepID=A0A6A8DVA4_9BACI|nr:hypothetical protein [Aquibacillus halophilus]MRH45142.1 hypothetical protein [Aquibacillus halophilus]
MSGLIIFLIVLFIITIGGTLLVGLQESKTLAKHKEEGDSSENQLERSLKYESSSLKSNLPILGIIYLITFIASIVGILIYLF